MAISVFQVQSPLTQVTRERTNEYLIVLGRSYPATALPVLTAE